MDSFISIKKLWLFSGLFIVFNTAAIVLEWYPLMAVVPVLLIIWSAIFALDKLMLFVVFCTPLSLSLENLDIGGIGMYLPTEPLLFGIMLVYFIKQFYKNTISLSFMRHPFTLVVAFSLIWIFITSLTSELPIVSFKYLLSRTWFVVCGYVLITAMFKDPKRIKSFVWLYMAALTIVILYTLIRHASLGFGHDPAHWVMTPFFKDHTSYGAVLAMFVPIVLGMIFIKKQSHFSRVVLLAIFSILFIGLIYSFTRAAWLSLIIAGGVYFLVYFKIKFRTVFSTLVVSVIVIFSVKDQVIMVLEKNKQDSSSDFMEHIESMLNISSDASNLERLNRWNCAIRMWQDRPVFGYGPGTYAFEYAPFQRADEKTIISTNFGDGGNAHSEYLGPLAEQGVIGMLLMLMIIGVISYTAIKNHYKIKDGELKMFNMMAYLGLVSYFAHGILNNYLDTDKASIPFWGFCAIIVAIDLHQKNALEESTGK